MGQNSGKFFGGVAGFVLGGPLGAILGVMAGSYFDRTADVSMGSERHYDAETVFWTSLSVLVAKLSKADGVVSKDEVQTFNNFLTQRQATIENQRFCAEVFNRAKSDSRGFESFADDIYDIWHHDRNVLTEIFILLVNVAKADGHLHPLEERFLARVAVIFRFSQSDYQRFMAMASENPAENIYEILGITSDASLYTIKKAYRQLVKENHPDTLASKGLPDHVIKEAEARMAKINDAYEKILKTKK
jgi:DnaJ like chaperone protein